MMLWLDWRLTTVALAMMPLSLWALVHYRRRLEGRVAELRQRSADIGSFLIETLQANTLVVSSNAQSREVSRFGRLNDAFVAAVMRMQRITYFAGGLPGVLLSVGGAVVFLYGGSRVIDGTLTLGTFVAFLAYQMRLLAPAQALMGLYASLATARVSWRRVLELLDAPVDVVESADARALERVGGEVAFEGVSYASDRQQPVLDDVSFTARPGEIVAFVGASGSGKSTIAHLIVRLLDPDRGVVRLDGHDLRSLRLEDIRRLVVLVEQQPVLLHATIAENLRYIRPTAGMDELRMAAEAAGIAAFIDTLPERYETVVGERGLAVSAGERQRIALARAFLARPAVLVLAEPTAALDPESERQVVLGCRSVMRGRTTVLISHRRELVMEADRVVVLDASRVVHWGPPADLVVGSFRRIFEQAGAAGMR
jgi:ATP-binding cassette subfamily B protein